MGGQPLHLALAVCSDTSVKVWVLMSPLELTHLPHVVSHSTITIRESAPEGCLPSAEVCFSWPGDGILLKVEVGLSCRAVTEDASGAWETLLLLP